MSNLFFIICTIALRFILSVLSQGHCTSVRILLPALCRISAIDTIPNEDNSVE
ncbi:hypothetical protein [Dysgonomonas sp. PF1-16]|uniref:hypothetical protein n=1 Tax=Dysgonomonas sp. PF1-16 TaxID=2940631 RepID=UPI0024761361|nr:hypothetical protein [Dysgonomonas sp. PF1-16]MDL2303009.1 hypothetical protein [Dysgonomonas sp. OttesenSCG-928-D17]